MTHRRRISTLLAASVLAAASAATAQDPSAATWDRLFPDNADVRSRLFSKLIGAPRELALAFGEQTVDGGSGPVRVRAVKRDDDFVVEFRNGAGGFFGETTVGTCLIQRSNAKGNYLLQARIFLQDDPGCYLRLYPSARGGTLGDVVMYGALLERGLALDGMLYQALAKPFPALVERTGRAFDWSRAFPSGNAAVNLFLADCRDAARPSRARELLRSLEAAASFGELEASAPGSAELGDPAPMPAGLDASGRELGPAAFSPFPRYAADSGLRPSALKAALLVDSAAHPGSVYALFGEGARAIVALSPDAMGRIDFPLFTAEGAGEWKEFFAARGDAPLRVLRLPAASP